jgi:protein involved in polysaccharide export with SLBB domain
MDCTGRRIGSGRARHVRGLGTGMLAIALWAASGCEHRISLKEFLAMQGAMAKAPTTQPATTTAPGQIRVEKPFAPFKVGPSDVLTVTVTGGGKPGDLAPAQARVRRDGTIELPLVDPVKVGDMELEDVEQTIKKAYLAKIYQEATVHVEVATADTAAVLVTGAVGTPGLARLRRNERNLLFAIVAAGGVSNIASGRVTLCRLQDPDKKKETLDLRDPRIMTDALAMPPLQEGDMVSVEAAKPNTVFVGGLVASPRPQDYPPGVRITVLQAIAASGGVRTDVTPTEATLIRRAPDGHDVHVKLDLDRLATGKDPNIELAAGDILWVPHTVGTRIEEWVSRNIRVGAAANTTLDVNFIHTKDPITGVGSGANNAILVTPGGGGGGGVP